MISENLLFVNFLAVMWGTFIFALSISFRRAPGYALPTAFLKPHHLSRAFRSWRLRRSRVFRIKLYKHTRTFRRWRAAATLRRQRFFEVYEFPRDVCGGFDAPLATSLNVQDGFSLWNETKDSISCGLCNVHFHGKLPQYVMSHHRSTQHTENLARRNQWNSLVNDLVLRESKAWTMSRKDDGVETAECLVCQKSFTSKNPSNLTKHHGTNAHKENVKTKSVRPWTCTRYTPRDTRDLWKS